MSNSDEKCNYTPDGIEVLPGQYWRDTDKRMTGRIVRVMGVSGGIARVKTYRNAKTFRESRIKVSRMCKAGKWEFVE